MEDISREQSRKQNKIEHFLSITSQLFTPFMAFKNQVQAGAICNLCKRYQLKQHHELVSCIVTKRVFGHFQTFLTAISPEILEEKEMLIGLETDPKAQKHRKNLRNLFTFTIRSTVHQNKWTNFSGMNIKQISNQLTERLKMNLRHRRQTDMPYVETTMKLTGLKFVTCPQKLYAHRSAEHDLRLACFT